ncbi:MAG: TonB-dependent receptor [Alphaproteobacteria bacterium]|nr:TonB-dependent receptor [Alphaproteobacteria bacterium]
MIIRTTTTKAPGHCKHPTLTIISTAALMASFAPALIGTAKAQDTEAVTVSASRVIRDGFQAPTPTTVIGSDDIAAQAQPNIYAAVAQLPSLMGSQSTATGTGGTGGGTNGLSSFAMRGLGTTRTLTLFDGQRIVPSNVTGVQDVSSLPQLLVQRVDVVTGGASASWGSDAITGVVNFITDKKFVGLKGNLQGGISTYGDNENALFQMAAGTTFLNGRGQIQVSGEYDYEAGVGAGQYGVARGPGGRKWFSSTGQLRYSIAATPAGLPQYTVAQNVQPYLQGKYGIITTGPLQGTAFGDGGAPFPFQYGVGPNGLQGVPSRATTGGAVTNCLAPFCIGGDTSGVFGGGITDISPLSRVNLYSRVGFDLTDNVHLFATVNFGDAKTSNRSVRNIPIFGGLNIQCGNAAGGGNAYLPASINQACVNNNITTFQIGTDNGAVDDGATIKTARTMRRFVGGADGNFNLIGTDWTWNTYFEHGEVDSTIRVRTFLNPYFNAAVDAVAGPNGTIVCRSTVARAEGCVPYNVFGNVPVAQSTTDWLYGGKYGAAGGTLQDTQLQEDAFSIDLNGAPFSTWAGPVSVAVGFEHRVEQYTVTGDPVSTGGPGCNDPLLNCVSGGNWFNGNFFSGAGRYDVNEGFLETVVPLLKDASWGDIDLNLAGRHAQYSTSGSANTWKVGVTWQTPIDGVRLRALQSRDIRAPNLSELFAAQTVTTGTVINSFTQAPFQIQNISRGNTALKPERSQTTEVGIVYQPSWFSGFSASVDYYRIALKGQISSFAAQQSFDLCFQGTSTACAAIITSPPNGNLASTSTVVTQAISTAFNLASTVTDGFDMEASYRFTLDDLGLPGNFTLRMLATHVSSFKTTSGVLGTFPQQSAGANSGNTPLWKGLAVQTYSTDRWSITATEQVISDGVLNKQYIQCSTGCPLPTANNPTINNNFIPGAFYLGIGGSFNLNENWQLFGKIDNVTNVDPPAVAATAANSNAVNPVLYDTAGRMYRVGIRLNM